MTRIRMLVQPRRHEEEKIRLTTEGTEEVTEGEEK